MFSLLEPEPASDAEVALRFTTELADPVAVVARYRDRLGVDAAPREVADAMRTDQEFRVPMQRFADASVAAGNPTWVYRFGYRSTAAGGRLGSCHGLDVPFVFDNRDGTLTRFVGDRSPDALALAMQRAWVAFARHGDPNHDGIPEWSPQTDADKQVIRFDDRITMLNDPGRDDVALWDGA
jgi:para-nitrobenzyl esterase